MKDFSSQILAGAWAPVDGAIMLVQSRRLWPYAAFPVVLGVFWSGLTLVELFAVPDAEGWFWTALHWLMKASVAAAIVGVQILIALCAPLLDWLSEQTEEELGTLPQGPPFWRELLSARFWLNAVRALLEAIRLLGLKLVLGVVAGIFGFIPQAGEIIAYVVSGIATGIDFVDYPLARRNRRLREKLAWARANAPAIVSYGAVVLAFLSVPGLGGLMLAPAVIGGTRLTMNLGGEILENR